MNVWRVFCAVELSDAVRGRLQNHIEQLRQKVTDASASWSKVENIHLTVKFFGNVRSDQIEAISAAASRDVHEFSSFAIMVRSTGLFPNTSQPQVIWIGVSDRSVALSAMQSTHLNTDAATD